MTLEEFNSLVDQAVDSLPEEFHSALSNVDIVVEIWPTRDQLRRLQIHGLLFGLYEGVPQTRRRNYSGVVPDKITVFAGPILSVFGTDSHEVRRQVRNTVLHEIGHHFGMSEDQIRSAME